MMDDDIVLVAPTGISNNNKGSEANDQYPAALGKDTALIAVNAVNTKGMQLNWSPGSVKDGVTVAAPGTGFCSCKPFDPKDRATLREYQDLERRYYSEAVAAATVAGVAAGLLAQEEYKRQLQQPGKVAANVKALVQGLAWPRAVGGPPVVWNGVVPYGINCKRGEDGYCAASPSATPTPTHQAAPPTMSSTTTSPGGSVATVPSVPTKPTKPTWKNIPKIPNGHWEKKFEGDDAYSINSQATFDTASTGYTGDPLPWCLAMCLGMDATKIVLIPTYSNANRRLSNQTAVIPHSSCE